ncbi:rhamnose-binding lectin-like [Oscarella lobularis]|uniref:rhamnose-binding lectin-like n=1 Tax=Oscarella lobularis TaxID=121494 RepID=UPI003313E7DE
MTEARPGLLFVSVLATIIIRTVLADAEAEIVASGPPANFKDVILDYVPDCDNQEPLEIISCEGDVARLTCPPDTTIEVVNANYGRSDFPTCPHPKRSNLRCGNQTLSKVKVKSFCNGRRHCVVTATNGVFGDPCFGTYKYLRVEYKCVQALSVITCEGWIARLRCPKGTTIQVSAARYGRTEFHPCPHSQRSNLACGSTSNSLRVVRQRCDNKQNCSVPSTNGVFGDPCVGIYKYIEASWTCKVPPVVPPPPPNSDKHLLVCEHKQLKLICPAGKVIQLKMAVYGRTELEPCPHPTTSNLNCKASNSFAIVNGRCKDRRSCSVSASNVVFGDPCFGTLKYLEASWTCVDAPPVIQPPVAVRKRTVCEGRALKLNCYGKSITIKSANYGRTNGFTCPNSATSNRNCRSSKSLGIVEGLCGGRKSCTVSATNGVFGDPCVGTNKYLEVQYVCS